MEIKCRKGGEECYGLSEMTLLFDISQRLIQSKQFKNDLNTIVKMVAEYLSAERCFLTILNRENEHIYMEAAYGVNSSQQARAKYKLGEGITGKVVEMARPVVVEKISKSSLFLNRTNQELYKDGKELTFVCVPVIDEGKVTGTLSFARVYNPYISVDEDTRLLSIIGSMVIRTNRTSPGKTGRTGDAETKKP